MKKIKIAACLMVFAFLFTGCKKEELELEVKKPTHGETIESIHYAKMINTESVESYDEKVYKPFEEFDFELKFNKWDDWNYDSISGEYVRSEKIYLKRTQTIDISSQYEKNDGETQCWNKNDSPELIDGTDWICIGLFIYCDEKPITYCLIHVYENNTSYYGWMAIHKNKLEIFLNKTPNEKLLIGDEG
tara:strand:+ start:224 stop:790 length:567 start_codon:yes stop_codon:yes gene_type:complete